MCPEIGGPDEPCFHAFSYTVQDSDAAPDSFVIAGSAESPEGGNTYVERIVRLGDTSTDALREKAQYVLSVMESRMAALGFSWSDSTATHAYTIHDLHPFFAEEIVARGAAASGLTWVFARPPVVGLEYEMDVRGVHCERVIAC